MSDRLLIHSQRVVNICGAVGYSLILFLYAFTATLMFLWVISSGQLETTGVMTEQVAVVEPEVSEPSQPSPISLIIAYLVSGFMLVTTVFVLISLPYWLGKLGSKLLKRSIRMCQIPVTPVSLFIGKLIACGLGMVPSFIFVINDIGTLGITIATFIVSTVGVVIFILQHSIAGMSHFEAKDIW